MSIRSETDAHHVVRVTIDRPDRKNAFDAELVAELTAATGRIDPAARVTGLRFDALRALEIGLVEAVEEPPDLDARVEALVAAILAGGRQAVNAAKRLVREVEGRKLDDVTELTVERIARARVGDEGQEGMRAFLEKREPTW